MPKITVLMSAFNSEEYINEAIDSILNQTFSDFEFIIIDDGSTDNSLKIIECYQDSRIRLIKNEINIGLTNSLIKGIQNARGKYLARMDADDISINDRLEKQFNFLEKNKHISIVGSYVLFFDKQGQEVLGKAPLTHEEIIVELLLGYTLFHPSVMIRLSDLSNHGLNYNPHYIYSQDFDLWTRASRVLKLANLKSPLIKMREHSKKISRALNDKQRMFSDEVRMKQLKELKINYTPLELVAFNKMGSSDSLFNISELVALESILSKIEKANHKQKIFDPKTLKESSSYKMRELCYNMLKSNNKNGLYLFRSNSKWNICKDVLFTLKYIFRTIKISIK